MARAAVMGKYKEKGISLSHSAVSGIDIGPGKFGKHNKLRARGKDSKN